MPGRVRDRLRKLRLLRTPRNPDGTMSLLDHLEELRYRILMSVAAYVVATAIAWAFYEPILRLLKSPLDAGGRIGEFQVDDLFVTGITTAFVLRFKVALFGGLVIALPVLLYHLWRFVTPGLERRERRYALPFVLSSVGLFALGTWFAFIVLPTGIRFLLGFTAPEQGVKPLILLSEYLSFVTFTIMAFGVTFEFPLLLIFLAVACVLSSRQLAKARRAAIVGIFVVAAVATPSQDPVSQLILAAPLYLLYEASILIVRFGLKR
jgi:sec-independent protein translocase protein TatC